MDCNMEEALRVKQIAEKKIEFHDFAEARRLIVKAQQLYAGLENVSQMLAICDVHSVAQRKVDGSDTDWYGILQVEPTADDVSVKKQYRKLALLLHPDKNKFCGAEAAFKVVGDAMAILSNQKKRMLYDIKRKATVNGKFSRFQCAPFKPHFGMKQSNNKHRATFNGKFSRYQCGPFKPHFGMKQSNNKQTQSGIHVTVQTQSRDNATQPTSATHQPDSSKQGTKGKGSAIPSSPAETPSRPFHVASKGSVIPSSPVSLAGKGSPAPSSPIPMAGKRSPTSCSRVPMAGNGSSTPSSPVARKGSAIPSCPIPVADNMSNIKMLNSIIIKMIRTTIPAIALVALNCFFYAIFKRIL